MKTKLSINSAVLAIIASISAQNAYSDGRIIGRISDEAKENYFEGAVVSIDSLNLQTSSEADGRFSFNNIPAGEYTISVSYLGAEPVENIVLVKDDMTTTQSISLSSAYSLENVLVVGQVASANKAINQMRSADNLVSVVTSDAIGQLPDENVSEALQRVSGVFIQRDQGEGRYVGIRGIDSNLNVTNINGMSIAAPEAGSRAVALDVIPSDLVESISVSKTLTPDMDSEAIGGSIDVKSISAFDREGLFYKVSGNINYSELQEETGHKVSGVLTNVFELNTGDLGLALSYSNQERNFGSENIETDGGWSEDWEDNDGNEFIAHEEMEIRDYEISREREGLAINLDFRLSEDTLLYSRYLYSKFGDQEYRNRFEYKFADGDFPAGSVSNTSLRAFANDGDPQLERELKDRFEEQEISSLLLGAETRALGWELEGKIGLSSASENEPNRIDSQFEYVDVAAIGYDSIGQIPSLYSSADAAETTNYDFTEVVIENNLSEDDHLSFSFDAKYDLTLAGNPSFVKFGLSLRDREKTNDANAETYEGDFLEAYTWTDFAGDDVDFGLSELGTSLNASAIRNFTYSNLENFELDEEALLIDSVVNDYAIDEQVLAYYLMNQIDIDNLRLTYGVRVEETETSASGSTIVVADDIETLDESYETSYSDILPSVNARYKLGEKVILRAAYFASIGRPSFNDMRPSLGETEIDDGEFSAEEVGNPNLQPFSADNIDLSFEYYPGGIGVLSAGLFYKKIDNFIFLEDIADTVNLSDFVDLSSFGDDIVADTFVIAQNGSTAEITGVELAWTKSFTSGLLLQSNATLSDSKADYPEREDEELPLVNQSDAIANFIVGYETDRLSARLSTAYQSKRLMELDDAFNDLYEDEHLQIDFSAKFNAMTNLQVFFNAKNLTDEPFYAYHGNRNRNGQYEEYGLAFELGLSYRNK